MIPTPPCAQANPSSTLKRSFTAIARSPFDPAGTTSSEAAPAQRLRQHAPGASRQPLATRRRKGLHDISNLPSAVGMRMFDRPLPSFMSVYGASTTTMALPVPAATTEAGDTTVSHPPPAAKCPLIPESTSPAQIRGHQHRESTSTQNSDSTDSSPTTTISTVDSSSITDPSPSSSPSSPIVSTVVPLSSFPGTTFGLDTLKSLKMSDTIPRPSALHDDRPMTSPGPRKSKNPKSLALNLRPQNGMPSMPEPPSASLTFIKPPTLGARKKPSLLSLNTGAASTSALDTTATLGPQTMLQRRGLKHSISSPQMLTTPGFGPFGGMTLGHDRSKTLSKDGQPARDTFTINEDGDHDAPGEVQMATRVPGVSVGGDSFDRPATGDEAKSPSYPDGPILMHEPSVHLYMEPRREEAMKFDVVINVAREVKNPFDAEPREAASDAWTQPVSDDILMSPATASSAMSFQTAFEVPASSTSDSPSSTPTTPRPNQRIPEYIHVPWDHNTDVGEELWDLCQLIESRVRTGKRVLIHCQQGASRSATLIIAYGMYINQDLGPNEAYNQAQAKSRWVNPNMSLLFSLNDFKKIIERKKTEIKSRQLNKHHRTSLSTTEAILPPTARMRGNSTPAAVSRDDQTDRPKDAAEEETQQQPHGTQHDQLRIAEIDRLSKFDFGFTNVAAPMTAEPLSDRSHDLLSPRIAEMTENPLQRVLHQRMPTISADIETPEPALFSPRAFEFSKPVFFTPPTTLATSTGDALTLPPEEDPRSPPMRGEAPITRSIDDFVS